MRGVCDFTVGQSCQLIVLRSGNAGGCLCADVCAVFVRLFCVSRVGLHGCVGLQIVIS